MNAHQFLEGLFSVDMFPGWTGELTFQVEGKEVQVHLLHQGSFQEMYIGFYFEPEKLFELKMQFDETTKTILLRNREQRRGFVQRPP